ncbi:Conserved_hypothetical protein [Hexamita inflata]|uniref:Uncharacterized protein n=2 Tax=Hexamita inflata TaxID=28002 RepID=A0AA86UAV6_9EUKA|nr:Conserved hypothetical protein [Hexamita inflata]
MLTLINLVFAKDVYPIEMTNVKFSHANRQSFYDVYQQSLKNYSAQIMKLSESIPKYLPKLVVDVKACQTKLCDIFTQTLTGKTATDFYIYQAFIDTIIDPMMAIHNQSEPHFGYSFTINNNNPNAGSIYDLIQKMLFTVESDAGANSYKALTLAGFAGYFHLTHIGAKAHAAFTANFGNATELPAYNEEAVTAQVQSSVSAHLNGNVFAGYRLLDFCLSSSFDGVVADLFSFFVVKDSKLVYSTPKLLGFVSFTQSNVDSGFYSTANLTYKRSDLTNLAQSSCETNLTVSDNSDFRTVQMERALKKLKATSTMDEFYNALRSYPFRNTYTAAVLGYVNGESEQKLQKCESIFDGKEVANCKDLPPPNNWWAIILSCLLIVVTITIWGFGIKFARDEEIKDKYRDQAEMGLE